MSSKCIFDLFGLSKFHALHNLENKWKLRTFGKIQRNPGLRKYLSCQT